ncbi:MAG: protein-glutamate O-methyltransferase CheR [Planctomycetota bacterium]
MKATPKDIDAVCSLVDDLCGICLDSSKSYLIEGRLAELVTRHGCGSYAELAAKARGGLGRAIQSEIVDAITTNETLWFRDNHPFEAMRYKLLPEMLDAKAATPFPRKLRVWSAACSTGQEAYSIAMAMADILPDFDAWDLQLYGTDISPAAVAKAKQGVYTDLEISRGLDQTHRGAYFVRKGRDWQINQAIRKKCRFEVKNLLGPMPGLGKFDFIFCRNVAIYFADKDRKTLFNRVADSLNPGGWLFVGSSESMTGMGPRWATERHCRAVCYRLSGRQAVGAR